MVASLFDGKQDAYYLGLTEKEGGWQVSHVSGHPATPPAALLREAPSELETSPLSGASATRCRDTPR
ncbi:MAG: hypothetical protein AB7S26_41480 [Sandaracinaceae bacterium]